MGKDFLDIGPKYDTKRGAIDDPNNLFEVDKFGVSIIYSVGIRAIC